MNFRRKITLLVVQIVLVISSLYFFPRHFGLVGLYDRFAYYPFQSVRSLLFSLFPFSLGDIIYVAGGIVLCITIVKWVFYIHKIKSKKQNLTSSVLNTINATLFVYLFFIWGWGANYYKQPLGKSWGLYITIGPDMTKAEKRRNDSLKLVAFNEFLIGKLNGYAPSYHHLSFDEINKRAKENYKLYSDSKVRSHGLDIKPTMFGYFMERLAVEGYYNPFTGEGQINTGLPAFIMPFVVCHEMAHQAGIAAEGDANLMAYAIGTATNDSTFNYAAYLNIWLYANRRLYYRDSALALRFEHQLNRLTTAHIDTLEQLSKKYDNDVARYSSELYDDYLKMQQQKEGLRSYGNVVTSAWQLELRRMNGLKPILNIP